MNMSDKVTLKCTKPVRESVRMPGNVTGSCPTRGPGRPGAWPIRVMWASGEYA